ncbi:MAG: hypothetical protein AAFX65_00255 [Cyanobacteria bacterium J06638_7]
MLFTAVYLISFAFLLVGALTLISQGFRGTSSAAAGQTALNPAHGQRRHPEAPKPGEPVLYVDLSRERLEQLYQKSS